MEGRDRSRERHGEVGVGVEKGGEKRGGIKGEDRGRERHGEVGGGMGVKGGERQKQ